MKKERLTEGMINDELNTGNLQLAQFTIEKQKLAIELQKLKIEESKLIWTSLVGIIPLLAVIATIFYGIWNVHEQEKVQFRLKATEIMFNSKDAFEMKGKSEILKLLFSDNLPSDFSENFSPASLGFTNMYEVNSKEELLKLLSTKAKNNHEIVDYWKRAFPKDTWVDSLLTK